jgi:hypothetical protein
VTLFFPSETPFFFFAPFRRTPPLSLSLRHSIKALEVKLWEDLATLLPKAPRRALLDALAASDRDVGAADRFLADRSGSSSGEAPGILDTAGGRGVGRVFHLVFKGDVQCSQVQALLWVVLLLLLLPPPPLIAHVLLYEKQILEFLAR